MKLRRIAWVLLVATLFTSLLAVFPAAETDNGLKNVALGAKYESSAPYILDADQLRATTATKIMTS